MRAALLAIALLALPAHANERIERVASPPLRVQLDAMPLGALTTMLMRDVMKVPYVIDAEVLNDNSPTSVNLTMPRDDIPVHVVRFLRSMGLTVTLRGGTVYVTKGALGGSVSVPGSVPLGSPLAPPPAGYAPQAAPVGYSGASGGPVAVQAVPDAVAVIVPAHRSVIELVDALKGALPDLVLAARRDSAPQGTEIVDRVEPDELVISGSAAIVRKAVAIVKLLDKPRPMVSIRAVVFEVRSSASSRSALSVLASIGGFEAGSSPGIPQGDQFIRIATGGLRAVLSATKGDGRFKVIAEPSLSALSGAAATINSGNEVPTIGSVSFSEDGTPLRSVVYRPSGISLTVTPRVRGGEIELTVAQERSSFSRTTTGVDDSPTLSTSKASTRIALVPGETIALAGLDQRSDASSRSGFLGGLLGGRSKDREEGQLLLVLQADVIDQGRKGETVVHIIDAKEERVENLGSPRKAAEPPLPLRSKSQRKPAAPPVPTEETKP